MKNLFRDYGEFYKEYIELVKKHRRSVTVMSILAGTIASSAAFIPLIIDKIDDMKTQRLINEFVERQRLIKKEEEEES